MINLLADSKYSLAFDLMCPLTTPCPVIVHKTHLANNNIALRCDSCFNTGEPAAVFNLLPGIHGCRFLLPESNAAGSLFYRSLEGPNLRSLILIIITRVIL